MEISQRRGVHPEVVQAALHLLLSPWIRETGDQVQHEHQLGARHFFYPVRNERRIDDGDVPWHIQTVFLQAPNGGTCMAHVSAEIPASQAQAIQLCHPVWLPGNCPIDRLSLLQRIPQQANPSGICGRTDQNDNQRG